MERYALFLVSLELGADPSERQLALTQARDHGLDMDRVAVVTAERTIERAFEVGLDGVTWMLNFLTLSLCVAFATAAGCTAVYHCITASTDGCRDVLVEVDRVDNVLRCNV